MQGGSILGVECWLKFEQQLQRPGLCLTDSVVWGHRREVGTGLQVENCGNQNRQWVRRGDRKESREQETAEVGCAILE